MKAYCPLFLAAALLLGAQAGGPAEAQPDWKIEKLSLAPVKETVRLLTASILHVSDSRRVEVSDYVHSQEIRDAFIWGDRLVLLGEAERASVVEIFDLARKARVDWFVCYQPRRIGHNWIAYREFFFGSAQGPGVPVEVLLVYDLARTPQENRMEKEPGRAIPPPLGDNSDNVVHVGIPVFPESNARQRSYQIIRETVNAGRGIDPRTVALLPSKKLVFRCVEESPRMGVVGSREYLAVVDLSRGLESPRYQTVDFPRMGRNGTNIERIEADSADTVRLVFPKGEYREEGVVVALPPF